MSTLRTFSDSQVGESRQTGYHLSALSPRAGRFFSVLLMLVLYGRGVSGAESAAPGAYWNDAVESALGQAGTNRQQLVQALEKAPADQREVLLVGDLAGSEVQRGQVRGKQGDISPVDFAQQILMVHFSSLKKVKIKELTHCYPK